MFGNIKEVSAQIIEELLEPPTISAVCSLEINPLCLILCKVVLLMQCALPQILGFVVGAIPWLKSFIIGENAPLHVIQETLQLLG